MARKFGANCSKCQRSTEQQQSIKCFKIHSKDLLQNNDFHITSSIFLLSSVLVFYFFLILFFNSIVYRFFIAQIFAVLPEYFRDWGGCRPPPPRLVRLCLALNQNPCIKTYLAGTLKRVQLITIHVGTEL